MDNTTCMWKTGRLGRIKISKEEKEDKEYIQNWSQLVLKKEPPSPISGSENFSRPAMGASGSPRRAWHTRNTNPCWPPMHSATGRYPGWRSGLRRSWKSRSDAKGTRWKEIKEKKQSRRKLSAWLQKLGYSPGEFVALQRPLLQSITAGPWGAFPRGKKNRHETSRQINACLGQSLWNSQDHLPLHGSSCPPVTPQIARPDAILPYGWEQPDKSLKHLNKCQCLGLFFLS